MKQFQTELSPHYYWENFEYVLRYVTKYYSDFLKDEEISWLNSYKNLNFESQCLYLRLLNRKNQWFLKSKIDYSEIQNIDIQLLNLENAGLLAYWPSGNLDEIAPWESLKKAELLALYQFVYPNDRISASLPLSDLKEIIQEISLDKLVSFYQERNMSWLIPFQKKYYQFFQFLFFGSRSKDLSEFVVRDLGHRQFFEVEEENLKPYFTNREDIDHKWILSEWSSWFYLEKEMWEDGVWIFDNWIKNILVLQDDLSDFTYGYFEKIGIGLGRWLERKGDIERALLVYENLLSTDALERRVRIHHKRKEMEQALYLAEMGLALSNSPKSRHFFEDYLEKDQNKKKTKKVTHKLKNSDLIEIDVSFQNQVEEGVRQFYENSGYHGFFVENRLWKSLMGLWGWELIFNPKNQGFHHPFQIGPSHMRSELFSMGIRSDLIDLLNQIKSKQKLIQLIRRHAKENHGKLNPFIDWNNLDLDLLEKFIRAVRLESLKSITILFYENLAAHSKGFPDLLIFYPNWKKLFFAEVKSPNDHLSAVQYFWNEELNKHKIESKIIRVKWIK